MALVVILSAVGQFSATLQPIKVEMLAHFAASIPTGVLHFQPKLAWKSHKSISAAEEEEYLMLFAT